MAATVTAEQNAYNLRTASRIVAADQGVNPAALPDYTARTTFNKGLANYILQFPQSFTDATLATAAAIASKSYDELEDTAISLEDFGNAALDEAGNIVKAVPGFLTPLLMVAIIAALGFYVLPSALAKARASTPAA